MTHDKYETRDTQISQDTSHKGVLSGLKARLHRNKLGELLVQDGHLSPQQLKYALAQSRDNGQRLGNYLVEFNYISAGTIRKTLFEQFALRFLTTAVTAFLTFSSMGFAKQARAGTVKDVPARMAVAFNSVTPASYHPKLFGSVEKQSRSLKAFTKWTGMFSRFDAALNNSYGQKSMGKFKAQLEGLQGLPLHKMAAKVNDMVNKVRYVTDSRNYGKTDYWATPVEFFEKGGDCEDFAITKYTALRALGVPENRLRIAIVQDLQKNIPHAILIVYTDNGPMVLDNQIKTMTSADRISHYKPIFSINRTAWWLHTKPKGNVTVVAAAAR